MKSVFNYFWTLLKFIDVFEDHSDSVQFCAIFFSIPMPHLAINAPNFYFKPFTTFVTMALGGPKLGVTWSQII